MKIRLLKPYGRYRRGDTVDVTDSAARLLIADGYAVEDRQKTLIETASVEQRCETADVNPKRQS